MDCSLRRLYSAPITLPTRAAPPGETSTSAKAREVATASAESARVKKPSVVITMHTRPKLAAMRRVQPRAIQLYGLSAGPTDDVSISAAIATHRTASVNLPPFFQATSAHAAITATSRSNVCSIGRIARIAGTKGASANAPSPRARRPHDPRIFSGAAGAVMLGCVALQIRNYCEIARALDGGRQLSLMTRTRSAQPARQNLSLVGDEPAKRPVVLVVDPAHASVAERAALLWSSHCRLILVVVVIVTARCLRSELFLTHRRRTDFVLVQRDEIANDAVVEPKGALVLGE